MINKQQIHAYGFTLVELLVTATIISLLAAVSIASYSAISKNSRDAKRKADLEQVRTALEIFRSQNNYYPSATGDMSNLLGAGLTTDYINPIPEDPLINQAGFTKKYQYNASSCTAGKCYAYCISMNLESSNPTDSCTPTTGYNYGVRHP